MKPHANLTPWEGEHNRKLREEHMAKLKQGHLPEMEPPRVEEIDEAADHYAKLRDRRMKLLGEEVEAQGELKGLMDKHKLTSYEMEDGRTVEVVAGPVKVKVRKPKAENNGEANEDEDQ